LKRFVWVLVAALVVGGLGVGAYFKWRRPPSGEPPVGGKTPEAWLQELRSADPAVGGPAALALADLGEPGLSVLLEARKDSDLRAHRRAARALSLMGAPAAQELTALLERGGARVETALVRMGPAALPALEKALSQPEQARAAARVLGGMGERARPAVGALIGLLQDRSAKEEARAEAAFALAMIGPEKAAGPAPIPEGDPVLGALTAALSESSRVRVRAARGLGLIGPPASRAVGALARLAGDPDVPTATAACEALGWIGGPAAAPPLTTRLLKADAAGKPAALALARLGPAARLAVGPLVSALKSDKDDGRFSRAVLERMGAAAVGDLEAACQDPDPATRRRAAEVLGLMGPRAGAAVGALIRLLQDRDTATATNAAQALVRIDPTKASPAVPVLSRLLDEKDEKVASAAGVVLADFGPDARAALPRLLAGLKSKDGKVVGRAAFVLGRIGPASTEVTAALRSALAGPAVARPAVVGALGRLGDKAALPDLLKALKQPDLRPHAALAVVQIDPARSEEVGRALAEDLAAEGRARLSALAALGAMPKPPAAVAEALRPLLGDRQTAGSVLRILGADPKLAEGFIPDLTALLSEGDAALRQEAGWALRFIGRPAFPAVKRVLSSPSPAARAAAAWTLGWSGMHAEPARDPALLLPLLVDKDEAVRQAAAEACASLGVSTRESVDAMIELLGSSEVELRRSAARALGMVQPAQRDLVAPHLVECLFDPDEEVRQSAVGSLGDSGRGRNAAVVEELTGALYDQSPGVRLAAAASLQRLGGKADELAPVLLALGREGGPADRREALQVLFALSPARARELLPEVEADSREETVVDRTRAAEWLVRLEPGRAKVVVPFLVGVLNGWHATAKSQAALVLGRLGPLAKESAPALKRRAEIDEDAQVRAAAKRALGKVR
jgi:HEAT repeat protein